MTITILCLKTSRFCLLFLRDTEVQDIVKMVGIGGRCHSEDIQPYTLQALLRQHKQDKRFTLMYEQQQLNAKRKAMDLESTAISKELSTVNLQRDDYEELNQKLAVFSSTKE